jgi:pimeloyl-ACP methyl ester carboxylesterase
MGAGGSMLWWQDEVCRMLAGRSRFVIRYDQRDTGRSTTYEPGHPDYTGRDLLADAVALLDGYRLPAAHLVGVSSGGALVQLFALDFPSRVCSLVLISTSPAVTGDRSLPPPSAAFTQFVRAATVNWSDADSVIAYLVAYARVLAGEERHFEEAEVASSFGVTSSAPTTSQPCRTTICSRKTTSRTRRCRRSGRPR